MPSAEAAAVPALRLQVGQHSERGTHARNQDCHGAFVPQGHGLIAKGAAFAIADGIGSSPVSHLASEIAVTSVLEDYFSTPDTWSVKKSAQRVIAATNAWLHAQSRQAGHVGLQRDQAHACTLSLLVLQSATAHVFQVGDAGVYRVRQGQLDTLSTAHRVQVDGRPVLTRVLGTEPHVELDYQTAPLAVGDVFVLMTDGVHEHVSEASVCAALAHAELDDAQALDRLARQWVSQARAAGSTDDATVQLVRVLALPVPSAADMRLFTGLPPCPPVLAVGQQLDGYTVLAQLHASSRSHVYLVADERGARAVMKIPSLDGRQDPAYLERLLLEDWFARRIASAHVVRSLPGPPVKSHLYVLSEHVAGITLTQWMREHPRPTLDAVRAIVEQVARGLQAMHRQDILHRDLRPDNILIDEAGRVHIIDLGSAKALGLDRALDATEPLGGMGTLAFSAPELFLGQAASVQSDQYALAAIAYQMLSGRLPYGTQAARTRSRAEQARLRYAPVVQDDRDLPVWIDDTLARGLHPDPAMRFGELSEFVQALRMPSVAAAPQRLPLVARHPVAFWQGLCVVLLLALLGSLARG
ncbi:hypothetical protein CCO03_10425 [Comamonas serinivorans]|uniref:Protein kinase n=1 Tax=Comamonas serinivorans TaxID=1082851 RepID=A0A1Y0EN66_9BURK|nr:bifunctional protein-serine/threonine kinase/phosphatase [Comamonas serinivorans]ARU05047.1 hypothetical protein CCO03_10425 [Comamonas serinivorans]